MARKCAISRKIHGRPCAARPIMMRVGAGVREHALARCSGVSMSPLAITGMRDRALDRGDGVVFDGADERAGARAAVHGERRDAGVLGDARDRERVAVRRDRGPVRILSVTGTSTARTTASRIAATSGSFASSAEPAAALQTFFAGQPMLMSMICAPRSTL